MTESKQPACQYIMSLCTESLCCEHLLQLFEAHPSGAQMVYCSICKNWFHHGHPKNCIGPLTVKQAAALQTDASFICEYCELDLKERQEARPNSSVVVL